jgi:hypothetical protein
MAVTRTLGPLHFEDLEPHRFEDGPLQGIRGLADGYSYSGLVAQLAREQTRLNVRNGAVLRSPLVDLPVRKI